MLTKQALRWAWVAAATSLLLGGFAWAEMRECTDCYPCGSAPDGGAIYCCTASGC